MGGETPTTEDSSDTQLQSAFKKLKVDPDWNPSVMKRNEDNLKDLWTSGVSQGAVLNDKNARCGRSKKKCIYSSSRVEPYPQDFLYSIAEKLTFHSEICQKQSCLCNDLRLDSEKELNYASSSNSHRPLIREAKLKLHHHKKDTKQVLRAARLKISKHGKYLHSKPNISKCRDTFGKHSVVGGTVLSNAANIPLFERAKDGQDFKTLASNISSQSLVSKSGKTKTFKFDSHSYQPRDKQAAEGTSVYDSASGSSRNSFSDCGKEMRQQAKIEDMSVDELAGYFEDFVHIPKKMSSMAEMMYT